MRKFIDILTPNLMEDQITKGEVKKGTWTYWQDHDGIYVVLPGSNTCYAGFTSQEEALHFAAELGQGWGVVRWGKFKHMTDKEAMEDHDVRHRRLMHGFWTPPVTEALEMDDEVETPTERDEWAREQNIMAAVKQFCEEQLGWDMDGSYPVLFDAAENELHITPDEGEVTLEQLEKLKVIGEVSVNAYQGYKLLIRIKTTPGFNITRQS